MGNVMGVCASGAGSSQPGHARLEDEEEAAVDGGWTELVGGPSWWVDDGAYAQLVRSAPPRSWGEPSVRARLVFAFFIVDSALALALATALAVAGDSAGSALLLGLVGAQCTLAWLLALHRLPAHTSWLSALTRAGPLGTLALDAFAARLLLLPHPLCTRRAEPELGFSAFADTHTGGYADSDGSAQPAETESAVFAAVLGVRLLVHALAQSLPVACLVLAGIVPGHSQRLPYHTVPQRLPACLGSLGLAAGASATFNAACHFALLLAGAVALSSTAAGCQAQPLQALLALDVRASLPTHGLVLGLLRHVRVTTRPAAHTATEGAERAERAEAAVAAHTEAERACELVGWLGGAVVALDLGGGGGGVLARLPLGARSRLKALDVSGIALKGAGTLAAGLRTTRALEELRACRCQLGDHGVAVLADALLASAAPLSKLCLAGNGLTAYGAGALASCLSRLQLLSLELAHNPLGPYGAALLLDALASQRSLRSLGLARTGLQRKGAAALAQRVWALPALAELRLGGNGIGDEGGAALLDALTRCFVLRLLWLNGNGLGSRSAAALSTLLAASPALVDVRVYANPLGGTAALADGLRAGAALRLQAAGERRPEAKVLLSLAHCQLADDAARTLADDFSALGALRELHLFGNPAIRAPARERLRSAWRETGRAERALLLELAEEPAEAAERDEQGR
ncbi:hypothetical protein T492DRAFT_1051642 [Pavlovales sp. CCMP2436]|nr:hypothetical protein T492DRAFT_1051642 [Pavlovales sp. CCMP2436]